ncbi:MAG: rRNA maturation RNase YbeY [Acidobacteriaceae bacterium]
MITLDLPEKSTAQHAMNRSALRSFLARGQKALLLTGEVAVLFTSDREIRRLNRTFRHKDAATDVLSFPAPDGPQNIAGDLAISLDTAARQAKRLGHPLQVELKILLLHGLLHLAGYDHETDAGEMAAREDQLRRRFRLPATLIARSSANRGGRR